MILDGITTVSALSNDGTLSSIGSISGNTITNNSNGVMTLDGTVTVSDIDNSGNLVNNGTIDSSTVTNNTNAFMLLNGSTIANTANSGDLIVDGTVTGDLFNDGILSGSGTVTGTVTNGGEFNPGNSPGVFKIIGDLNLLSTSVLNIEIAGLEAGVDYDVLDVTGNILFDGKLNIIVDSVTGYTGALQDSFDPIVYSSGSGDIELTSSIGYGYQLTIEDNKLNLLTTLVPGLLTLDTQSEVVTLVTSAKNITEIENPDDIEEELLQSEEDDEKSSTLVCS